MRIGYKKKHRAVGFIILLGVIILFSILLHTFLKRAEPAFVAQTSNYSNTAFTDLVNKSVIKVVNENDFDEFFKIVSADKTSLIEADTAKINLITSKLLIEIQDTLNADYPAKLYIPIGSLTDYYLLSSLGPQIPVTIIPISVVSCEVIDHFDDAGINQVRHELWLHIAVDMHYRGYLLDERERIEAQVPIAQTIITGDVPQYYGNGLIKTGS